ncbi:MAG: hypothetical protein GF350_16885, partial [Chitinivibrionales bacterium]|nr:hypothetical protein [Chitinivibrionales bacterium]
VDGSDGSVVERYAYDPYGKPTVMDADFSADADGASDVANEILYCGYRIDPETGLYHVRHRPYHPTLGRWGTRDRIGYLQGANLYEYASSLPLSRVDPNGLEWQACEVEIYNAADIASALAEELGPLLAEKVLDSVPGSSALKGLTKSVQDKLRKAIGRGIGGLDDAGEKLKAKIKGWIQEAMEDHYRNTQPGVFLEARKDPTQLCESVEVDPTMWRICCCRFEKESFGVTLKGFTETEFSVKVLEIIIRLSDKRKGTFSHRENCKSNEPCKDDRVEFWMAYSAEISGNINTRYTWTVPHDVACTACNKVKKKVTHEQTGN